MGALTWRFMGSHKWAVTFLLRFRGLGSRVVVITGDISPRISAMNYNRSYPTH